MSKKPQKEKIYFRVTETGLRLADNYASVRFAAKNYKVGDIVAGLISKPRSGPFNRLVHGGLGKLCAQNIERFSSMENDPHEVIKCLQIESGAACDVRGIMLPGFGLVEHRTPRSLSYESMDESEYNDTMKTISRYVASQYWPTLEPEQIEQMALVMVNE